MSFNDNVKKFNYYLRRYGIKEASVKVFKRVFHIRENRKTNLEQYKIWLKQNELTEEMIEKQVNTKFEIMPKISIVIPMYNTDEGFLKELIDSVKSQTYSNWEICFADGSETLNNNYEKYFDDERIKYKFLNSNKGISENTNEAIKMVTGDYVAFMDHDDLISKDALYEVVKTINEEKADFIYSDEDKIDESYERFEPYFKPDYSPETLECNNYITHLVVVSKKLLDEVGMLDSKFNGAQDFDFVLRATEKATKVSHISKILYHWRVHKSSTANVADAKPYAYKAGIDVIKAHLDRIGKKAEVTDPQDVPGIYKIKYDIVGNPKVSILIPNKDNIALLKVAVESILDKTSYDNYEIVIIENNSKDSKTFDYYESLKENSKIKVLNYSKDIKTSEFNYSSLINYGVKHVDGEYVLQLNNDVKVITKDWLELLIGYCQNKEIGAVGARLYYEDKTIQHAGIIVGLSGIAGNMLVNLPFGKHAYFGREAATRNVSAVTGACLFARREVYEEVGYMDEDKFKVAFNDVDFCLKLIDKGYRIVYNPYVELFHYESKSRGYDEYSIEKEQRFNNECDNFKNKWKTFIENGDPYYNKNLSMKSCNYDINIEG